MPILKNRNLVTIQGISKQLRFSKRIEYLNKTNDYEPDRKV